jgi:hypothetical protein
MLFTETSLKGAYLIEIEKKEDQRGFFASRLVYGGVDGLGQNVPGSGNVRSCFSRRRFGNSLSGTILDGFSLECAFSRFVILRFTLGGSYDGAVVASG